MTWLASIVSLFSGLLTYFNKTKPEADAKQVDAKNAQTQAEYSNIAVNKRGWRERVRGERTDIK